MKNEFKVIAALAGISLLLEGCSMVKVPHEEFDIIDKAAACEEIKAESSICEEIEERKESDDIAEESHPYVELGDSMEIPLEVGARVIVEYPDGNVYEFFGEEFDITDNSITVFFEKEGF